MQLGGEPKQRRRSTTRCSRKKKSSAHQSCTEDFARGAEGLAHRVGCRALSKLDNVFKGLKAGQPDAGLLRESAGMCNCYCWAVALVVLSVCVDLAV